MPFAEPWYVETRAQAYAVLQLTRRGGVNVSRTPRLPALDLMLTIGTGNARVRHCGVVLLPRVTAAEPARLGPERIEREQALFGEVSIPVCMVSFAADDAAGEFRWIAEPRIDAGRPFLALNPSREFQPLSDDLLDEAVGRIATWYERRAEHDRRIAAGVRELSRHPTEPQRRRRAG
jgi:hypothetical protein